MTHATRNSLHLVFTTLRIFFLFTVILGIIYPIAMYGVGRIMPEKADGSMITNSRGDYVGSSLIAQKVNAPGFFFPRPSNAGEAGYDAMGSAASNLSPFNMDLQKSIASRRKQIAQREHVSPSAVPLDAITASGSGLDLHISTRYAYLQAPRVARERGISQKQVKDMIADASEGNFTGSADGAPVNVVKLNKALNDLH